MGPFGAMVMLLFGVQLALPFVLESQLWGAVTLAMLITAVMFAISGAGKPLWCSRLAWAVAAIVVLAAAGEVQWGALDQPHSAFNISLRSSTAVLMLLGVWASISHTLSPSRVDTDKIFAAIGALFLLALSWGYAYLLLEELMMPDEALFTSGAEATSGLAVSARQIELTYFSLITLTTVGYGDISPLHPVSRSLASLEGLTGQLYLTVLVARLVALHISPLPSDSDSDAKPKD